MRFAILVGVHVNQPSPIVGAFHPFQLCGLELLRVCIRNPASIIVDAIRALQLCGLRARQSVQLESAPASHASVQNRYGLKLFAMMSAARGWLLRLRIHDQECVKSL